MDNTPPGLAGAPSGVIGFLMVRSTAVIAPQ